MKEINIYEVCRKDGELVIVKNPIDDDCSFVEFIKIKNLLNVASNIAQDLISDIFGDKYDETTLQYHMERDDIEYIKLVRERIVLLEEAFDLVKNVILSAPLSPVGNEDAPIIVLFIAKHKVKKILEEKIKSKILD